MHKKVPGFLSLPPETCSKFFFEVDRFNMYWLGGVEDEECQYQRGL